MQASEDQMDVEDGAESGQQSQEMDTEEDGDAAPVDDTVIFCL